MIDIGALFKVSYGMYVVSSGDREHGNGFISNTLFQVTAEPPRFAACCSKNNYTTEFILRTGAFSASVLHRDASPELLGRFGYRSGRDFDKMEGMQLSYGVTGVPVVLDDALAWLECRVVQTVDVGTHLMFIGELLQAEILDAGREPLTYLWYRQVRRGASPKNAPTFVDPSKLEKPTTPASGKKFKCIVCGYVYDEAAEGIPFAGLPAGWTCPLCDAEKEDFVEIINQP